MISNINNKEGFSLIETLLYAAFFSLVIGVMLLATYNIVSGSEDLGVAIITDEEANFLLRKMEWALSGVNSVTLPLEGASGAVLSVNKEDYGSNPIIFDLNGGDLRIQKNLGSQMPLNSENIVVSDLNFEHIPANGTRPAAIEASFYANGRYFELTKFLR